MGREGKGRDGKGRDGTGRDGTGRDGTGRDGTRGDALACDEKKRTTDTAGRTENCRTETRASQPPVFSAVER
eukprot:31286-Pelagococcus_subviridis.AAC.3